MEKRIPKQVSGYELSRLSFLSIVLLYCQVAIQLLKDKGIVTKDEVAETFREKIEQHNQPGDIFDSLNREDK